MKNVISPVTGKNNTREIRKIPVDEIIRLYQSDFEFPVDRFFTGLEHVYLMECLDTKYRFYYPYTVFGDSRFYEELQQSGEGRFGGDSYYPEWKWEYSEALQWIKKEHSVLDIGCGSGTFLQRLKKDIGSKVKGLEFNTKALEECHKKGIEVYPVPIQEFSKSDEKFDVITYFEVLEHIDSPLDFIESSLKSLKPGGKLIIGVPNNSPYYLCFDIGDTLNLPPHHAGLWSRTAFESLRNYLPVNLIKISESEIPSPIKYLYYFAKGAYNRIFGLNPRSWIFYPFAVLILPFSIPLIVYKWLSKELIGRTLVVVFEKT